MTHIHQTASGRERERRDTSLASLTNWMPVAMPTREGGGGGSVLRWGKGKERQSRKGGAETDHYGRSGLLLADPWLQHNSKCHRDERGALWDGMPEEDPNKPAGTGRDKPTACQLQLITTISNTFSTSNNSKKVLFWHFLSGKSNSNCKPNLLKKKA